MPTYEYACTKCEHRFEEFQSITAKPLRKCPQCGKSSLKRLIGTGAGILFKGSGFYCTDYRSDGYKKAADSGTAKDKPSETKETKTEAKTESKPAATPAPAKTDGGKSAKKKSA